MARVPVIAIVGRPNVGKSTVFNRLSRSRDAIVQNVPGVTRDRLYRECTFDDRRYVLIDTGGLDYDPKKKLSSHIQTQVELAIDEADVVLHVVDLRADVHPLDTEVSNYLRRVSAKVIVVANKADLPRFDAYTGPFYAFGFDEVYPVSAEHGRGFEEVMDAVFAHLDDDAGLVPEEDDASQYGLHGSLDAWIEGEMLAYEEANPYESREDREARLAEEALDRQDTDDASADSTELEGEVLEDLFESTALEIENISSLSLSAGAVLSSDGSLAPETSREEEAVEKPYAQILRERYEKVGSEERPIRIAFVGRPNVGKSSFVNKILGEERHVVSPVAGTTMDAVDSGFTHNDVHYALIDTAGIRKKRKIHKRIEKISVSMTLNALDSADVALLLIDSKEGLTEQDIKVAAFAHDKGCALLIVCNKWDLLEEDEAADLERVMDEKLAFIAYAPRVRTSALTGRNVYRTLETVARYLENYFRVVSTSQLNRVIRFAQDQHQAPSKELNRRLRIYFSSQVCAAPPTFVLVCNEPRLKHFSYVRYLKNQLRKNFDFGASPVRLIFRKKNDPEGRVNNLEARARRRTIAKQQKRGSRRH